MSSGEDCLFCRIVSGEIPSEKVYQDEWATAFRDINPQAPTHILVIPNRHIASLAELRADDQDLMGRLVYTCSQVAASEGLGDSGYRLVVNCGNDGGQEVGHIHFHILGGRRLTWPPG